MNKLSYLPEKRIVPASSNELKRRTSDLIRRGISEIVPGTGDSHAKSLAAYGSIFDAARDGDIGKVRGILAIDPIKANDRDQHNDWRTPLLYASEKGHAPIIEILLEYGTDINAGLGEEGKYTTPSGEEASFWVPGDTPLLFACFHNRTGAAELLIQRNADVNEPNWNNYTPLHAVSINGNEKLAELLLSRGANTSIKAHACRPSEEFDFESDLAPLHIAARYGHSKIIDLLLRHGAEIDLGDFNKRTPLMYAARMGHVEALKILLKQGADIEARSQEDYDPCQPPKILMTSSQFARKGNHWDILKILNDYRINYD